MFFNFRAANFVFFLLHILSQEGDCLLAVAFLCSNKGGKSAFVSFESGEWNAARVFSHGGLLGEVQADETTKINTYFYQEGGHQSGSFPD